MKAYGFTIYMLLMAALIVMLDSHVPMHYAIGLTMFGSALALIPVIIGSKK